MKKVLKSLIAAAISATFVFPLAACSGTPSLDEYPSMVEVGSWIVTSPDGDIRADMKLDSEGSLTYTIKRGTEYVVEPSNLGLDIVEDDLRIVSVDKVTERRLQGVYANKSGKTSSVEYDCNELTLTLKGYKFYLDVVMRAYDDGYAFRYNLRAIDGSEGTVTVESENSEFAVPSTATIWTQVYQPITGGNFFAYENSYVRRSVTGLQGEYLSFPMLYRLKKSDTYSLVTESELIGSGFYGSFLKESEDKPGTGILQTVPTPAGCMENDNQISYPFTSPWRVGITGDLNTVIESELVEKVYGNAEYWKPDNYDELSKEEQEIYNYDWVDSGVAAWNWLIETSVNGNKQQDYEMHRRYLHLASDMGWKYVLLDSGWERDVDPATITAFMQESKNLGVKVLVWCNSLVDFPSKEYLQYTLDRWAAYGIAGIKIDFFDGQNAKAPTFYGEDTETIAWYETIYQECAKRKMLVNCHGSNKPTGERRVYPNVINREGVYGNEFKSTPAMATVNSMFTRGVIGPSDFTPTVKPLGSLSIVHQMALAVLYESGTPSMADEPSMYLETGLADFYKAIPALRDKTVFVGGEPDSYYCAAVNSGDNWLVAGINSVVESTVEIDFSFLGSGTYTGYFYFDTDENSLGVEKQEITVTSSTKLTLTMKASGGFVYQLKKQS